MESFELMGYWWLPGNPSEPIDRIPEKAIPGKLSFDPKTGGLLELLGNLDTDNPYGLVEGKKYEIVQGFVSGSNHCVTLQRCLVTSTSFGSSFSETKLHIGCIFKGYRYWFDTVEDIVFDRLTVSYSYLDDWMSQSNFGIDVILADKELKEDYRITYTTPEPIHIQLESATIEFWAASSRSSSATEVSLKEEYRISVTTHRPSHLFEFLKYINFQLRNFMSLATGQTNFPINVWGEISDERGDVSIHYKIIGFTEATDNLTPWPMLFTYSDVKESLQEFLWNWMQKSELLEATYSLYFREHYSRLIVLDSELLGLAQALEAYHRNVYGGEYLSKEEYESVRLALANSIPNDISEQHRDALISGLRYGHQYSFRTRLKRIFCEVLMEQSADLERLVGDTGVFIHRLVETRNYFTHRDGEPNKHVLKDNELYAFTRKMRLLLQICFLKEMGFPPEEISRLLGENQAYQHYTKDSTGRSCS